MGKKKILVVDDDTALTDLLKHNLEATGKFEVKVENDGTFVYKTAVSFVPDLILLDIIMKDMHGTEAVPKLKEDEITKNIPIIFLTGIVPKEEEAKIKSLSGLPYITKPIKTKDLIRRIEEALRK